MTTESTDPHTGEMIDEERGALRLCNAGRRSTDEPELTEYGWMSRPHWYRDAGAAVYREHLAMCQERAIPWRCFHCGEVFTDEAKAAMHFGAEQRPTLQSKPSDKPACKFTDEYVRDLEEQLARYRADDSDLHRHINAMSADHATALLREEEKGYDRGLSDGQKLAAEERAKEAAYEPDDDNDNEPAEHPLARVRRVLLALQGGEHWAAADLSAVCREALSDLDEAWAAVAKEDEAFRRELLAALGGSGVFTREGLIDACKSLAEKCGAKEAAQPSAGEVETLAKVLVKEFGWYADHADNVASVAIAHVGGELAKVRAELARAKFWEKGARNVLGSYQPERADTVALHDLAAGVTMQLEVEARMAKERVERLVDELAAANKRAEEAEAKLTEAIDEAPADRVIEELERRVANAGTGGGADG
jgi:hypothetical protein